MLSQPVSFKVNVLIFFLVGFGMSWGKNMYHHFDQYPLTSEPESKQFHVNKKYGSGLEKGRASCNKTHVEFVV